MSAATVQPVVVAYCRPGFEAEAAADLAALGTEAATTGPGYVVGNAASIGVRELSKRLARRPPVFARSVFVGAGPLGLATGRGSTDRVTPLVEAIVAGADAPVRSVWVEHPDTNDGKALSPLARALAPRLESALTARGRLADDAPLRQHVFLVDKATAYVGVSDIATGSSWPMGIPRLRMPHGAPSRSTAKLAEAVLVFLGDRETSLLRSGMRAVDLGAAPGGWTWQLAYRGLKVTAVDNGALKGDVAIDPRVTHVRADGLAWRPRTPVDWLVCDIVLQPIRIAELVAGWIADGAARHAIFNLKLPMKRRYAEVERCRTAIETRLARAGIRHALRVRQLYHDREEVTGFLTREI